MEPLRSSEHVVRGERPLIAVVLGLLLCVTVPLGYWLNIWIDEGYSLHTTSGTFAFAMKSAREFEMQPPMYFVELWLWRQLSDSIFLARLSSIFAAAGAVWCVYLAAKRWLTAVSPVLVAGLYSANVYALWAAVEIRPYSLVQFFTAALLVLFYDAFYTPTPSRAKQVVYAVLALIALYTYYFLGFVLLAMAAPLLIERRWSRLALYVGWMAGVGVLFIPEVLYVYEHMESVVSVKGHRTSFPRAVEYVTGNVFSLPFGLPPLPATIRWSVGLFLAFGATASVVALRKRVSRETLALWSVLAVLGACYGVVVKSVMREEDLTIRHLMIMIIPSLLVLLSIVAMYSAQNRRRILIGFCMLWFAFNGYAVYWMFSPMAKSGDYRRVATYLAEHQRPGDGVAVATSHAALPLRHYYKGSGKIYPLPFEDNYDRYVIERWQFTSAEHARESMMPAVSADGVLWLFTDRGPESEYFGVNLNFKYLEEVLSRDFDLLDEHDFFNGRVRKFQLRPQASRSQETTSFGITSETGEGTAASARSLPAPQGPGSFPPHGGRTPRRESTGTFGSPPTSGGNGNGGEPRPGTQP